MAWSMRQEEKNGHDVLNPRLRRLQQRPGRSRPIQVQQFHRGHTEMEQVGGRRFWADPIGNSSTYLSPKKRS